MYQYCATCEENVYDVEMKKEIEETTAMTPSLGR